MPHSRRTRKARAIGSRRKPGLQPLGDRRGERVRGAEPFPQLADDSCEASPEALADVAAGHVRLQKRCLGLRKLTVDEAAQVGRTAEHERPPTTRSPFNTVRSSGARPRAGDARGAAGSSSPRGQCPSAAAVSSPVNSSSSRRTRISRSSGPRASSARARHPRPLRPERPPFGILVAPARRPLQARGAVRRPSATSPRPLALMPRLVPGDRQEPGPHGRPPLERPGGAPRGEKRLLQNVLRCGGTRRRGPREAKDRRLVTHDELIERLALPGSGPLQQLLVGQDVF